MAQEAGVIAAEQAAGPLLSAALDYARRKWPVFPCHSPRDGGCDCPKGKGCPDAGKHPRTQHGLLDATCDELQIRRWWKTWPRANIGMPVREGFVIVDVDGPEGLAALKEAGHQLAPTAVQATGRGHHYVYRTTTRIGPKVGILPKVDLRGPGSYVVAAPSLHASGKTYGWQIGLEEIAEAPLWIGRLGTTAGASEIEATGPVDMAAVLSGVSEGRRDVELFRAACKLRAADIPIDFALRLVREAAERCRPRFDAELAERKVHDAYRKYPAGAQARDLPSDVTLLGEDAAMVEFEGARFAFHDLEKTGRELHAEMEVQSLLPGTPAEPYIQRLNLLSMSARESCRRELEQVFGKTHGWGALLSKAAFKAQDAYLKVDRGVRFSDIEAPDELRFIIDQLAPEYGTTILFGSGSAGKTLLLYAAMLAISHGIPFLGRPTERRNCLVIDYETGRKIAGLRMRRVAEGMGLTQADADNVHFWWANGIPLHDQVDPIRRYCEKYEIGCVGLDHLAVACGGNAAEQEAATRTYRALSKLDLPAVCLAHITGEAQKDPESARKPFGSIFWENGARRTIFVLRQQEQESSIAELGLFPRKSNDGVPPSDFGATIRFDDPAGPISIEAAAIRSMPSLNAARGKEFTVWEALRRAMTEKELAEASGVSERHLKNILPAHPRMFQRVQEGGGRNHPNVWARASHYSDGEAADVDF